MKGRKPYPADLLQATNDTTRLTKDELESRRKNEPKIQSAILRCPSHLSRGAKREWRRIVKLYEELDKPIMCDLDLNALEIYCETVVTYRKAMDKVRETSEVYASKQDNGRPKKNPWLAVANDAALQIKRYGEVLLMDPVSRARIGLAKSTEVENDPIAAIMRRARERNSR